MSYKAKLPKIAIQQHVKCVL